MIYGRWLTVCWNEMFDELGKLNRADRDLPQGILFIQPPFADITLVDGLWEHLNNIFGKMFDMAEEEDVENAILLEMVDEIKSFVQTKFNRYKGDYYEVVTGQKIQPENKEIKQKISVDEYRHYVDMLCDFFYKAHYKNKNVIVML